MPGKFGLDGGMIPRNVRRMFDQRDEPRFDIEGDLQTAVLTHGAWAERFAGAGVPVVDVTSRTPPWADGPERDLAEVG